MTFSLPGLALSLVLFAGVAMAPVRAAQAVTGRFTRQGTPPLPGLGGVRFAFLLAFVFWCAVVWAAYATEVTHRCSGDTCIGVTLPALPFPFVYAWAEWQLFKRRRAAAGQAGGPKA